MALPASGPTPPLDGCGVNVTIPGAHIQGYPTSGPNARAVPLIEHLTIVRRLEAERDAAELEVRRLEWAICHLLMRDGTTKHGGRVSNRLLARAVADGAA